MKPSKQLISAIIASTAVALAVITGLFIAGSPAEERTRRMDDQRVEDLRYISYAVESYYQNEGVLPASLEEAARQPNAFVHRIADPVTGMPYEYLPSASAAYQLCATFDAPTNPENAQNTPPELSFWNHDAGRICYALEARTLPTSVKPLPLQ